MAEREMITPSFFSKEISKRDQRKIDLLKAVIRLISEEGWEATTLDKIGRKFGMRRSHVAYYFEGRDEMLLEAIRYVAATAQACTLARFGKAAPGEELRAVVDGAVDWAETHPDQGSVFLLFYHLGAHKKLYRALQTEIRAVGVQRIQEILKKTKPRLSDKNRLVLSKRVQNLITGCLIDFAVTNHSLSFSQLRKEINESVVSLVSSF